MLTAHKIFGFVPTKDTLRAKMFYQDVLDLELAYEDQFAVEFRAGGDRARISKAENFEPWSFAILGWDVEDIERVATGLKARGVDFETYTFLKQNPSGIWNSPSGARVAWFKDPDGNVLSISQHPVT